MILDAYKVILDKYHFILDSFRVVLDKMSVDRVRTTLVLSNAKWCVSNTTSKMSNIT